MKLTRDLFVPCIDLNRGVGTWDFKPIDLSTIFALAANPQEETYGYICYANDYTEVTSYQPELLQEIVLDNSNPIYLFMKNFFLEFPKGSSAQVPILIVFPDDETGAATDGMLWANAIISPGEINSVDGKISFSLKLNGDFTPGTVAISGPQGDKTIEFTPDSSSDTTSDTTSGD